jgi:hypothetical protein
VTKPVNLIVVTDASMVNVIGYHGWVISTSDEDIITAGGGYDDGDPTYMNSYRFKLDGITTGIIHKSTDGPSW